MKTVSFPVAPSPKKDLAMTSIPTTLRDLTEVALVLRPEDD